MSIRSCFSKYVIGGFIAIALFFWLLSASWPLSNQSVIGIYRYSHWSNSAPPKEYIQLLENSQYMWVADKDGAIVKAKGRWQISNWGWAWSELGGRHIILENIQFFDSSGLKVEFSGAALSGGSYSQEGPQNGRYNFSTYFGQARRLVALDHYWIKEK